MEALILLVLIGVIWIISSRRWRRRIVTPVAIFTLISMAIASPPGIALATQGMLAFVPADAGNPVDSIVVLGRGEDLRYRRTEVAEDLWRTKRSPKIFASGMLDAEFMLEHFKENKIPSQAISGERCSQSTEENALFTSAVLHPQGVKTILLITDAPHILRSVLSFRSSGFTVVPHPVPLPPGLSSFQQLIFIGREYAGLASYALSGRFKERSKAELDNPRADVAGKLATWNCQLSG